MAKKECITLLGVTWEGFLEEEASKLNLSLWFWAAGFRAEA